MASARVMVPCPAGVWTKVATNVTTATIHKKITSRYYHDFTLTGVAPGTTLATGIFLGDRSVVFNNSPAFDVYIWCQGKAGLVGVDA